MRHLSATLLIASAFALPTAAHADTLDDFVLTGNGHTYTFSLPSSGFIDGTPCCGLASNSFLSQSSDSATVDGIGGYGIGTFFSYFPGQDGGHATDAFGFYLLYSDVYAIDIDVFGPASLGYTPIEGQPLAGPYDVFYIPGTYNLFSETFVGPVAPIDTPYTITITPEATSSPIPEPSTLALLGTGSLALLSRLRRSVRR